MELNASILMGEAKKLGVFLKISPKEAWDLFAVGLSFYLQKPQIDLQKLEDRICSKEDMENDFSIAEVIENKYGKDALTYIETLL